MELRKRATIKLDLRRLVPSLLAYLEAGVLVLVRTLGKVPRLEMSLGCRPA